MARKLRLLPEMTLDTLKRSSEIDVQFVDRTEPRAFKIAFSYKGRDWFLETPAPDSDNRYFWLTDGRTLSIKTVKKFPPNRPLTANQVRKAINDYLKAKEGKSYV